MSQLLSLVHEESINKLSELTKRTYTLEQQVARLEEYNVISNNYVLISNLTVRYLEYWSHQR